MEFYAVYNVADNHLGFNEVIVYTEALGTLFVGFLAEGCEHDYLEVSGFWSVAEDVEHIETADFWHHGVEQHEVGLVFFCSCEGIFPVRYAFDVKAFGLQTHKINIGESVVVFDEQDLFGNFSVWHTPIV